jgi:hypothetical protein
MEISFVIHIPKIDLNDGKIVLSLDILYNKDKHNNNNKELKIFKKKIKKELLFFLQRIKKRIH